MNTSRLFLICIQRTITIRTPSTNRTSTSKIQTMRLPMLVLYLKHGKTIKQMVILKNKRLKKFKGN